MNDLGLKLLKNLKKKINFTLTRSSYLYPLTILATIVEPLFLEQQSEDYCNSKAGGFYDDPESCENFIICFADKTFKIPCAHGTMWDHVKKQCDFSGRSILII